MFICCTVVDTGLGVVFIPSSIRLAAASARSAASFFASINACASASAFCLAASSSCSFFIFAALASSSL